MAIDTREKRASILGIGLAAALVLPAPDASVASLDRQQVAFSYAGIQAGESIEINVSPDITVIITEVGYRVIA